MTQADLAKKLNISPQYIFKRKIIIYGCYFIRKLHKSQKRVHTRHSLLINKYSDRFSETGVSILLYYKVLYTRLLLIKILINNESFPASYFVKADMHPALQPVLPVWRL